MTIEKGDKLSEETKLKISKALKGKYIGEKNMKEMNGRWNGGNSDYPNHAEFKRARVKVLKKSKGKCEICGEPAKIVHHIDEDKGNHLLNNLIAVCRTCHEPLHCDTNGDSVRGRQATKYNIYYNMTVKEMADKFGVTRQAIYYWIRNPKKKEWLEKQLTKLKK